MQRGGKGERKVSKYRQYWMIYGSIFPRVLLSYLDHTEQTRVGGEKVLKGVLMSKVMV